MLKTLLTVYVMYMAVVLLVYVMLDDTAEWEMKFWWSVSTVCQVVARQVGLLGLHAENRYHMARSAL